jgi:hypothetical protein
MKTVFHPWVQRMVQIKHYAFSRGRRKTKHVKARIPMGRSMEEGHPI